MPRLHTSSWQCRRLPGVCVSAPACTAVAAVRGQGLHDGPVERQGCDVFQRQFALLDVVNRLHPVTPSDDRQQPNTPSYGTMTLTEINRTCCYRA